MVQPKHVYTTGIVTGAVCGILAALTAYKVMSYIAEAVATKGNASVWSLAAIMGIGGAVVGAIISAIVHHLNK